MEVYSINKGCCGGVDYKLNFKGWGDDFLRESINNYTKEHKISKKYLADKYNLTYSSFLKFLRGGWGYGYDHICRDIIQEQECNINKSKYNLNLNNCEIEIIKLFCDVIKNNKDNDIIKISGTSFTNKFNNILAYLKDNDIDITIKYLFNGRGDNDPYIDFKINSYDNSKIDYILNMLKLS